VHREEPSASQLAVFGATLRLIRLDAGMTQLQLGNAAGMRRTYITELETGERNPTLVAVWQLATALGVSPRSFFPHVESADTDPPLPRRKSPRND
jgi:transcriptional regulator with XRE-family HTH domain